MRWVSNSEEIEKTEFFPCDHFDMMLGSDAGGLAALLLTAFRMTVEDALEEFYFISLKVYQPPSLSSEERSKRMRDCLEDILSRRNISLATKLANCRSGKCLGVVIAAPIINVGSRSRLRNYQSPLEPSTSITLIDAIMATCASQPSFSAVSSGLSYEKRTYVGGSLGASNPIRELISEAFSTFGADATVSSILSLGCGYFRQFVFAGGADTASPLDEMLTTAEQTADEMERQLGHLGAYTRFTVDQSAIAQPPSSDDSLELIASQTEGYLERADTAKRLKDVIRQMSGTGRITLNSLQRAGGPKPVYKEAPMLATHYIRRIGPWNAIFDATLSPSHEQKVIVVSGMAGCGKTQLVTEFVREFKPERNSTFQYTFFVDASSESSIEADLVQHIRLCSHLGDELDITDVLNYLRNPFNPDWLLVIDNADRVDLDLRKYLPKCEHGTILVTTRNQSLKLLASKPEYHIALDVMSVEEAVEVILRCAGRLACSTQERAAIASIAERLGYLPVALSQAGYYMRETMCSGKEYLAIIGRHIHELMRQPTQDRQKDCAYAAFDVTYQYLTTDIRDLTHILSYYHFANFPIAAIAHAAKSGFGQDPYPFETRGGDCEAAVQLLRRIFTPDGNWSDLTIPNVIATLQRHSLSSFNSTPLTKLVRLHPLMREWAYDRIPSDRRAVIQIAAVRLLACCLDAEYLLPYLPPHVEALRSRADAGHLVSNDRAVLAKIVELYGQGNDSRDIWMTIHEDLIKKHGRDHLHVALAAFELAATYDDTSLDKMEAYEIEAIKIRGKLLGPRHLETLEAMQSLSWTYTRQERPNKALKIREETLRGFRSQLPPDHPEVVEAERVLALAYVRLGKLAEAEVIQVTMMEDSKKRFGEKHPNTLTIMDDLAKTYHAKTEHKKAEELRIKIVEVAEMELGETHEKTTDAIEWLTESVYAQGRRSEAEALQIRVLEGRKAQYGDNHRRTIIAMDWLAEMYYVDGRHEESVALLVKVLDWRMKYLGEDHRDTATVCQWLAKNCFALGRLEEAIVWQEKVMKWQRAHPSEVG